jgi:iron complex transport system substrate-binding protein
VNNIRNRAFISLALAIVACLCACAAPASPAELKDDAGNTITSAPPAERIISLAPANTEIIYALGQDKKLVGVTEFCNYPPAAKDKPKVGGFSTVDIEKAVALSPDLLLAAEIHNKSVTPQLQKMGFRVVSLYPKTVQGALQDITLTGRLCGAEGNAATLTAGLQKRLDAVAAVTAQLSPGLRPRVLVIIWNDPPMVAGNSTLIDDMVRLAGGSNVASQVNGFASMNLESIIGADPQVIIVPTSMDEKSDLLWNFVTTDPRMGSISAVKNGRLYRIDGDLIYRHSPRCITALEQIAAFLHPDLFNRPAQ